MSQCEVFGQGTQLSGNPSCPCLPLAVVNEIQKDTENVWIGGTNYSFGDGGVYPARYGVGCAPHDAQIQPYCGPQWCSGDVEGKCAPYWCSTNFCWVNATNCTGVSEPVLSSYFSKAPRGSELSYSYETCGSLDGFGTFYASVTAPRPPPPMLPFPFAPPPSAPPRNYDFEISMSSVGGALALLIIAAGILWLMRKTRLLQEEQMQIARERAKAALETTHNLQYTAAFIRASDFIALGRLTSHEALRNQGKLIYRDRFGDLALGDDYTVFVSHQWTSWTDPDPTNEQYPVMCAAIQHLAVEKLLKLQQEGDGDGGGGGGVASMEELLDGILIWVDYSSIPQVSASTTKLAIQSLSAYSSLASSFVIVAPSVVHSDTGATCDFGTYRRRAWCRAEQLCHLLRNGMDDMYVATSETSIQRLHRVSAASSDPATGSTKAAAEAEAEALFAAIDGDGDGDITAEELREYLSARGEDEATTTSLLGTLGGDDGRTIGLADLRERLVRIKLDSMTESDWLGESIRVFAGDITNEMDKLALVQPILGLYAELYAVCAVDKAKEIDFAHDVLRLIQGARDEILPKTFTPAPPPAPSSNESTAAGQTPMSMRRRRSSVKEVKVEKAAATDGDSFTRGSADFSSPTLATPAPSIVDLVEGAPDATQEPADGDEAASAPTARYSFAFLSAVNAAAAPTGPRAARPIDLFGILVETIENIIDKNEVLRNHLHKEYLKRRGLVVTRKLALLSKREAEAAKERSSTRPRGGGRGGSASGAGGGLVADGQRAMPEDFV